MSTKISIRQFTQIVQDYPVERAPRAAQYILNEMATQGKQYAHDVMRKKFILRNRFTINRVQHQWTRLNRDLRQMQSAFGALPEVGYLADQESGFIHRPKRGNRLPVPTRAARIGGSIERLKRSTFRADRMGQLSRPSRYRGTNRVQRTINMLQSIAANRDQRPFLAPFPNKPGVYIMRNVRRRPGRTRLAFRLKKIYDLSKRQETIAPHRWMEPAADMVYQNEGRIAQRAWERFLFPRPRYLKRRFR